MTESRHLSVRRSPLLVVVAVVLLAVPGTGAAAGKACDLLTPGEIQSAVGQPVSALEADAMGMCHATSSSYTVLLRLAKRAGGEGAEEKGIAAVRQMGGQIDVKTFGTMTCSTLIPPANLAASMGFNTTCSILKDGWVAAVEIGAKAQKDMVPVDRLRAVAEKMSSRF